MKNIYFLYLTIFIGLFIAFFSLSTSAVPNVMNKIFTDKQIHFLDYALLTFFLALFLSRKMSIPASKTLFWSIGAAFIFGVTIELIQLAVPGRFFEFFDIVANVMGSFAGGFLWIVISRIFR